MKRTLIPLIVLLAMASSAAAQTIYNPSAVWFSSTDHTKDCATVQPCVSGYIVEYWIEGVDPLVGAPVTTSAVAKAEVEPSGDTAAPYKIQLSKVGPVPIGNTYVARLIAVGVSTDVQSVRSDASNPFASATAPAQVTVVSVH